MKRILDAVGWKASTDLRGSSLIEPSAGDGAFLTEAARRLVLALKRRNVSLTLRHLRPGIKAFELHRPAAEMARTRTMRMLVAMGVGHRTAQACATAWIVNADFLLADLSSRKFTHAVGNPPYVRWSRIPPSLKRKYETALPQEMTGGDLFVPFLDRSLDVLVQGGHCGFLCSDRWQFMRFAEGFRKKWLPQLHVQTAERPTTSQAYVRDVDTYPMVLVASKTAAPTKSTNTIAKRRGKTLEDLGYVVKVGPALGHTPAFVLPPGEGDVEHDLLSPWIDSSEILDGAVKWQGRTIATMHDDSGNLIDLARFPLLKKRMERFRTPLRRRSIVTNGAPWYRPIDRVRAIDWRRPKLVVPELAKTPRVAIDRSGAIPSHGVYAIFAPDDDVETLFTKLCDGQLAKALEPISPKIKGGYVRCYRRFLLMMEIRG